MPEIQRLTSSISSSLLRLVLFIFRKRNPYLNLLACLAICLLVGCDETTECGTTSPVQFTARFVKKGTTTGFGSDLAITFDTIRVIGSDSTYYKSKTTSSIVLPLNPTADGTTYLFKRNGVSKSDTITLTYKRKYQLISPSCAPAIDFANITLQDTSKSFDSLTVTNNKNDLNQNNVQIYL